MKLNPFRIGTALALSQGILSVLCALASYGAPSLVINVAKSLPHALDLTPLVPSKPMPFEAGAFFLGLVSWMVLAWVSGWLFGVIYNAIDKGKVQA